MEQMEITNADIDAAFAEADARRVPPAKRSGVRELAMRDGQLALDSDHDIARLAEVIHNAPGMGISGASTISDTVVALMAGLEVGLSATATLKNVMVVNGKPSLWGDALLAVVQNSGELAEFEEHHDDNGATCRIVRVRKLIDGEFSRIETVRSFTIEDAKTAGLWGKRGPWKQYPKRMLQMRARSFALRDAFADRLGGLSVTDEVRDYQTFTPSQMTGQRDSGAGILDAVETEGGAE